MKTCACKPPVPFVAERKANTCVKCAGHISAEWTSATIPAFYDRLQGVLQPGEFNDFTVFRAQAEAREVAGRKKFGHRHLGRDNIWDTREEAADGANYLYFHLLQARREGGHDVERIENTVLVAAYHYFKAHQLARSLKDD